MTAKFSVNAMKAGPNSPADDGEIHIAGLAPEIGFVTIAELMHAKDYRSDLDKLRRSKKPVSMTGIWRLWNEHGSGNFTEGSLPASVTLNTPHVWEIHPLTKIGNKSYLETFLRTIGHTAIDEDDRTVQAFHNLENSKAKVEMSGDTLNLEFFRVGYNFLQFDAKIGESQVVSDGRFVRAEIYDWHMPNQKLASNIRLVFAKGTPPESVVKKLIAGSKIRLIGFCRINLSEIWESVKDGLPYSGKLPYEIIVTATRNEGD